MRFSRDYRELRFKNTIIPLPYLQVMAAVRSLYAEAGVRRFYTGVSAYLGLAWKPAIQQARPSPVLRPSTSTSTSAT